MHVRLSTHTPHNLNTNTRRHCPSTNVWIFCTIAAFYVDDLVAIIWIEICLGLFSTLFEEFSTFSKRKKVKKGAKMQNKCKKSNKNPKHEKKVHLKERNPYLVLRLRGETEHDTNDNVTTKTQNTFNTAHMNTDTRVRSSLVCWSGSCRHDSHVAPHGSRVLRMSSHPRMKCVVLLRP